MRAMKASVVGSLHIESTDSIQYLSGFRPNRPFELHPTGEMFSTANPLWPAFEEFVSMELWRAQFLAEAAGYSRLSVATDTDSDWGVLNILSTANEENDQITSAAAVAESLSDSLPFMSNISLQEVAEFRVKYASEFDNLRSVILKAGKYVHEEPNRAKRAQRAHEVVITEIQPTLAEYTAKVTAANKQTLTSAAAAAFAGGALIALFALTGPELSAGSGTMGGSLGLAVRSYLDKVLSEKKVVNEARGDPMFFLWKLGSG